MKQRLVFLFFLVIAANFVAPAQNVKQLDPQNFEKKLKEAKDPIIVDVRTQGEYAQGHLANANLIDFYGSDFKTKLSKLDKTKPVFVYCAVGGRSNSAVTVLSDMGFKEVYDLRGGINAWRQSSKPIEKK